MYQHLEYFAFGETFVEEHSNTDRTPYLFNGKELDEETGLYYYGARYYDAKTSLWQSVDPMAEKASGWTPYRFGLDNPIRYSDPEGGFEIDEATRKAYPKFDAYLKSISTKYKNKPDAFRNAFKQWSGLSDGQISEMIEYGKGPKISVMNLDKDGKKVNGQTFRTNETPGTDINRTNKECNCNIAIDDDVVKSLENALSPEDKEAGELFVESTVFHEATHYGDNKDGKKMRDKDGKAIEVGKEFEKAAYGKDVGRGNYKQVYTEQKNSTSKKNDGNE